MESDSSAEGFFSLLFYLLISESTQESSLNPPAQEMGLFVVVQPLRLWFIWQPSLVSPQTAAQEPLIRWLFPAIQWLWPCLQEGKCTRSCTVADGQKWKIKKKRLWAGIIPVPRVLLLQLSLMAKGQRSRVPPTLFSAPYLLTSTGGKKTGKQEKKLVSACHASRFIKISQT